MRQCDEHLKSRFVLAAETYNQCIDRSPDRLSQLDNARLKRQAKIAAIAQIDRDTLDTVKQLLRSTIDRHAVQLIERLLELTPSSQASDSLGQAVGSSSQASDSSSQAFSSSRHLIVKKCPTCRKPSIPEKLYIDSHQECIICMESMTGKEISNF